MDKTNKNPNVPNLRFEGFENDWRIHKLGDITKSCGGGTPSTKNNRYWEGNIPWISSSDLFDNDIRTISINRHITNDAILNSSAKLCPKSTICIVSRVGVGKVAVSKCEICTSQDFMNIIEYDGNKYFLAQLIQIIIKSTQLQGTSIKGITSKEINNFKLQIPTISEQDKIMQFLELIEDRIQTQIKIIEDYSLLREHIIDFIFKLQDLSLTSYSFNDIFKERKEYHVKDENVIHATLSKEGLFPKTDRYDRDFLVKDLDKKYKISYLNDIVYNPANLKFGVITRNNYGTCIISPIYITYEVNKNVESRFIELFVTRKKFLNEIRRYEQGTVYERMAVNSEDFLSYEAKLPSLKNQREIVSKIEFINKKINQENVYLDLLKKQKQYLLSNMFI